jgi:hypothetical protein
MGDGGRHQQPDQWPGHAAGDDPDRRAAQQRHDHRNTCPDDGGDQLAPTGDQPDGQADHRGREDDVDAEPSRVRDLRAQGHAGQRGQVPRDERRPDRRDPVPAFIGPPETPEVGDRQREGLVGQEVGHDRPPPESHLAQPRRQGGGVEQVPGVEQRGQEDDPGPRQPARDVADGRKLGRSREDDRAHGHRLDHGEARLASGEPIDEAEARGRHADPDRVGDEPPAAPLEGRGDVAQRRKVLPQIPSHTT